MKREPYRLGGNTHGNRDSERTPGPGYIDDGWGIPRKKKKRKKMPIATEPLDQIEALEDVDSTLTKWERDFVASIREWIEADRQLTDSQATKLDQIHEERVLGVDE